jgi:hypothetical protein
MCLSSRLAQAQDQQQQQSKEPAKIELGIHFSSIQLGPQVDPSFDFQDRSRSDTGIGVRFGYNLNKHVAVEAEGNFFPQRNFFPALNSGGSLAQGQFGVKAGKRFERFGLFAKARPGFVTFGDILTQTGSVTFPFQGNGPIVTFPILERRRRNFFSMDVGAVVELYPSRGVLVRFDLGDTMINYGDTPVVPSVLQLKSPRLDPLAHKFQFSAGIAFRYLNPETPDETDANVPDKQRKLEIGAQFTSLNLRETGEDFRPGRPIETRVFASNSQPGAGARIGYNFTPSISAEVQADYYPGDIGEVSVQPVGGRAFQIQAGPKLGKRFEHFGFFVKARPGLISFSNVFIFDGFEPPFNFRSHFGRVTHFTMDVGGVLEFYPSRRVLARFDCGDTMIRYGERLLGFLVTPTQSPSTFTHQLQFSAGVGFRF